jgi:hypothetical protein
MRLEKEVESAIVAGVGLAGMALQCKRKTDRAIAVLRASRKVRTPQGGITVNDRPSSHAQACGRRGLGPQRRVCSEGVPQGAHRHGVAVV